MRPQYIQRYPGCTTREALLYIPKYLCMLLSVILEAEWRQWLAWKWKGKRGVRSHKGINVDETKEGEVRDRVNIIAEGSSSWWGDNFLARLCRMSGGKNYQGGVGHLMVESGLDLRDFWGWDYVEQGSYEGWEGQRVGLRLLEITFSVVENIGTTLRN